MVRRTGSAALPLHGGRMPNQKESATMKCLRIYATPDGESHFDEVELPPA